MSGSKLTSLLQYRFVKKDQKSPPNSQSSGSVTLSPSQTSTQPPVTPDKSTTSSQRTPSSPGSPIFGTKPKLPGRNLISSPSQPSSSSSSPWLSKENGVIHNGNTNNNKPRRSLPSFPDQEVDFNRLFSIKDYEGKLSSLRQMFPSKEESVIQQGLIDGGGDVENAIDIIIGLKSRLIVNSNRLFSIKDYEGKLSSLRQMFPSKEESVIQQGLIDGDGNVENAIDIIVGLKSRLIVNSNRLFSIKDYEGKLSSLRQMFPSKEESVIQQGLIDGGGDVENAIDIITGLKSKLIVNSNKLFSIKDYEGKLSSLRQMFPSKEESVIQQGLIDGGGDVENAIDIITGLKSRWIVNSNKLFSIKDYEGKLSSLRQMFPSKEESVIQQGLIDGGGDVENAIDIITGLKSRWIVNSNKLFSIKDYEGKLSSLRQMFPSKEESVIQQGLIDGGGDVENAIDIITGLKNKGSFKRIITDNHDSTSDPDTPIQPRKRIRTISSDSDEALDSQQTVSYGLESQRSDATEFYDLTQDDEGEEEELTDEMEKKVKFLSDCFKDKSRKQIVQALSRNGWVVADATGALSEDISLKSVTSSEHRAKPKVTKPSKPAKDIVALDDDDDDEEDYGGESDDSIEEESNDAKSVILNFFDDASFEELIVMPGCSKKKAEMIVSQRPFKTWETMTEKFTTVKGLSYDLISSCREVIKIREVIIRLMQRCEKIASSMGETVSNLIHSNTQLDDANHITKQPSNLNPDLQLKPFQMVGLNWLRLMHTEELNGILADEMGLGKTIQAISFLAHLLSEDEVGPHVIIVPSSTIDNWIREAKRWCPSLKVLVYYGSQEDRRSTRQYILQNTDEFHVIITTYNMVTGSLEDRSLFKKFEFHYAIFDEGHLLKNMSSLRYQNLMRISAQRRLLLTGTPLQNNLLELMSLLCFVMPDMFIGKTEQLKRMFTMITKTGGDEKRSSYEQERIAHAKRIMRPFVLRRLKSEVMSQLPKKSEQLEYCTMIPSQQEVYDKLITRFSSQIEESYTNGGAGMLMHLRKAANHPLLHRNIYDNDKLNEMAEVLAQEPSHKERGAVPKLISEDMQVMSDFEIHNTCKYYRSCLAGFLLDESLVEESGKFRLLDDLLVKHKEKGDRVLLFSQFTSMMDIMEIYLKRKKYKFVRLDGSTPVPDRQKLIDDYNNDKSIFIFILSTKAGGLGINLTSANVVILHDIDFNPYNDKQAEDRCHRVGQTREVQIVRLISKDTVEEAMLKCAQEKLKLEQDVISTDIKDEETGNMKDVASILKQALAHDTKKKS